MDINFNKHYNHGIEIRFLDFIKDQNMILDSFEFIIYLMDYILESDNINYYGNPITNKLWNNIVLCVMKDGKDYNLTNEEKNIFENMFNITIKKSNILEIYCEIYWNLFIKYNKIYRRKINKTKEYIFIPNGKYSSLTLNKGVIINDDDIQIDKETYVFELFEKKKKCYNCFNFCKIC